MTTYSVFDTSYAKNNQDILRWASVAIAGFLTVLTLIWAAMIYYKPRFNEDCLRAAEAAKRSGQADSCGSSVAFKMLIVALFFMITVASAFLSWFIASLHMAKNNLIALDVLNVVVIIFLSLAAYFYYKDPPSDTACRSFLGSAFVLEFVALIVLMLSPTTAGNDGSLTQSALAVPLLVATTIMLMHSSVSPFVVAEGAPVPRS